MKLKKSRIQLISCYLLVYLIFRKPVRSLLLLPCTSVIHGAAHVISSFFNDIYSSTKTMYLLMWICWLDGVHKCFYSKQNSTCMFLFHNNNHIQICNTVITSIKTSCKEDLLSPVIHLDNHNKCSMINIYFKNLSHYIQNHQEQYLGFACKVTTTDRWTKLIAISGLFLLPMVAWSTILLVIVLGGHI